LNVLVTGGAGFSGSIFGRVAADAGHNITIIDQCYEGQGVALFIKF